MARQETINSARYCMRLHERNLNLWKHIGWFIKAIGVASGAAIVVTLVGKSEIWGYVTSLFFLFVQIVDLIVDPADEKAKSTYLKRGYARLWADPPADDVALEKAYKALVVDDDVIPRQALRELAYNDVIRENGLDPSAAFTDEHWFVDLLS